MRLLCTLLVLSAATLLAEPPSWRFARPDADTIIGLNWKRLMSERPGELLRQQLLGGKPSAEEAEYLSGVSDVLIAIRASGNKQGNQPDVVILRGQFNLPKLRQLALAKKARVQPYGFVELITPQGSAKDMSVALVSAEMVVLGDAASLREAIDQPRAASARAREQNVLFQRAEALAAQYDAWFVSMPPASRGPAQDLLKDVRTLEGGMNWRDGIELEMTLRTADAAAAQRLAAALQMVTALAKGQQTKGKPGLQLIERMRIQPGPAGVQMALSLPRQELERSMGQVASRISALASGSVDLSGLVPSKPGAAAPAPKPAAPEPAGPQVIRIYGLDDGPREIKVP